MKIIELFRGQGKTTSLIILSHFTNARIITTTEQAARNIIMQSKTMNLHILTPMNWNTYITTGHRGKKEKILFDDLDGILNMMFSGQKILGATITKDWEESFYE